MNRNPIKNWAITFPKSGNISRMAFVNSWPPYKGYGIGQEKHKDGSPHLHLLLRLKKPLSISKMVKWVKIKYPDDWKRIHMKPVQNITLWRDYIKKEDPDYIEENIEIKPKRPRYTQDMAMHDITAMMMVRCEISGEAKAYELGPENRLCQELKRFNELRKGKDDIENQWLINEGYGPFDKRM